MLDPHAAQTSSSQIPLGRAAKPVNAALLIAPTPALLPDPAARALR